MENPTSLKTSEKRNHTPIQVWIAGLIAFLVCLVIVCICLGQYDMSLKETLHIILTKIFGGTSDWKPMKENIIFYLRLPRIIAAGLVGASLALSGSVYQGIFRNPLVSPDLLGVSSGACVGAALSILLGFTPVTTNLLAFVFGLAAVALTLLIPKLMGSTSNIMLVLSGVIVSGLMGSFLGMIKYVADPRSQLQAITFWQMGSFASVRYGDIVPVSIPMIVCFVILLSLSWWIDVLSMGETEAKLLGAKFKPIRNVAIVCASILTASSVCMCGTISWVGLVIPHFSRMLVGAHSTRYMPVSCLLGASFMIIVDTTARIISGMEVPISILTSLIGAPFYIMLMRRQKGELQ